MAKDIKLGIIINQKGDAKSGLAAIASSVGKLGGIAATAATGGLLLAVGGVVALGKGLFDSVGAAMAAQEGQAQLAAVLESTNSVSGMTVESINALASSLQKVTPFEDDAILAGQNLLLTFTNIGKDVFPAATATVLDMATALGTDTTSAAMQLGKALNDPVAGISALTRVGVTFTDGQKEQIKAMVEMGNTAGAQQIILAELNKEFGGSAVAAGETLPGKLAILKNTFGDIQETIGAALLPALSSVADQLAAGLQSPQAQVALQGITDFINSSVVPAIGDIMVFVGDAITLFMNWSSTLNETTGPAMLLINDALNRISIATGGATGQFSLSKTALAALSAILTATTTAIKLIAVAAQGAAWYFETWATIIRTVKSLGSGLAQAYTGTLSSIKSGLSSVISKWNEFKNAVKNATAAIPSWLVPGSPTPFEIGLRGIAGAAKGVAQVVPGMLGKGTKPAAPALASAGQGPLPGVAGALGGAGLVINFTYSPVISLADRFEAQNVLAPFIAEGVRAALAKKVGR